MRVDDLISNPKFTEEKFLLRSRCSDFISESYDFPLIKNLPTSYGDFRKVKVRKRKAEDTFTEAFNDAFENKHHGLRQRAIFANGPTSFAQSTNPLMESFYIFPTNGYKFMYSREVENSDHDYKQVFEAVFDQFGGERGNDVLTDLLRFTYVSTNLSEGIELGAEIIVYGIPFYYAVRTTSCSNYQDLLTSIADIS